ncbi:MAG: GGDEF domain-containing protein [Acidobacteriaceae bacterium]|nr:GGDEF domain-containing protein [Acidobacteriaceae bacterium]
MSEQRADSISPVVGPLSLWSSEFLWWKALLVLLALVPLLTPLLSPNDDGAFMYPYMTAVKFLAAGVCFFAAQRFPSARFHWRVAGFAFAASALGYVPSFCRPSSWFPAASQAAVGQWCPSIALCGCWIAVSFPRKVTNASIRFFDITLFLLSLFVLEIGQHVHLNVKYGTLAMELGFLLSLLIALVAQANRTVNTASHLNAFFRVLTIFLWSETAMLFLVNLVDYTWLPKPYVLLSDLLCPLATLLFCAFVFDAAPITCKRAVAPDSLRIENAQASILVVASILLAFYCWHGRPMACGVFIAVVVACYVARTTMLQRWLLRECSENEARAIYMETLATHDPLTGIGNRRSFEQTTQTYLATTHSPQIAVMLVDADKFKGINDAFGHHAGDAVLCRIAEVLQQTAQANAGGCCARFGGDEFALMLLNVTVDEATRVAEMVRLSVTSSPLNPYRTEDAVLHEAMEMATVSIGVAVLEKHRLGLSELLRWADTALYSAKEEGRDRARVIDLMAVIENGSLSLLNYLPRVGRQRPAQVWPGSITS